MNDYTRRIKLVLLNTLLVMLCLVAGFTLIHLEIPGAVGITLTGMIIIAVRITLKDI